MRVLDKATEYIYDEYLKLCVKFHWSWYLIMQGLHKLA